MATYAYKAKDQSGKTVGGTLEADTRSIAADAVREMGLVPINLTEIRRQTVPAAVPLHSLVRYFVYPIWTGVGVKMQMLFFRQLATMLQAGMILSAALASVSNQTGNRKMRRIAREAQEHVSSGGAFSDVLLKYPWIFTRVQTGLIRAGEAAGSLDAMIDRIADYLEQEMDIRRIMRASTLYPKLLVIAALTIPNIRILVLDSPQAYLKVEADLFLSILKWLVPAYVLFRLMAQFDWFKAGYDTIKVSIPVLGAVSRKSSMARFSRSLALLYSGGMPMAQAVQISADAVGNFLVRRAVLKAVPQIAQGVPASEAMRRTGQVPQMVLDMLSTGEKTGNVDMTLNKVAEYYEKESESTVKTFGVILFVVLVLAVAVMIAIQVLNFWTGFGESRTNVEF